MTMDITTGDLLLPALELTYSADEAIAITQHPTILYRMRVENFQLNSKALAAVSALTASYNASLYSDFLR